MQRPCPARRWWAFAGLLALVAVEPTVPAAGDKVSSAVAVTDHRLIVRYAEAVEAPELERHVHQLNVMPGVLQTRVLLRLNMAVVACDSQETEELMLDHLEADRLVELAVPDTPVELYDARASGGRGTLRGTPKQRPSAAVAAAAAATVAATATSPARRAQSHTSVPQQCSAHPACHMRHLAGDCCPAHDGTYLSCCSGHHLPRAAFRTYLGTYLAVSEAGRNDPVGTSPVLGPAALFQIISHGNRSVSLKNVVSNMFLSATAAGKVSASSESIGDEETFHLSSSGNGTLSLESSSGMYLALEHSGQVHANAVEVSSSSQQFTMVAQAAPGQRLPDDQDFPNLWGMHHYTGHDIAAMEAWRTWTGEVGAGIAVAVIDTGIDYMHEDLSEQMWVNPLEIPGNGIDDDGNGFVDDIHGVNFVSDSGDPWDDQMHGTHCSGTIAGIGNNNIGVTGVAWRGVRLMALKFLSATGGGRTSDALRAIDYAVAHGARVASNSWGGGGSNSAMRVAIERAEAAGMLFIVAAGNSGSDNDEYPQYPANYDVGNIVSVASVTSTGELSDFSCYGAETVHLAAPGSRIYSSVPGNQYTFLSGTSMATPHVSGLAALVWMYRPQLSMPQVRQILMGSVRQEAALAGRVSTGGMLNAKNALEAAWAFDPPQPPVNAPQGIVFQDTDPAIGVFAGTITITAAADESDVDYYRVYYVSGAGYQLDAVGEAVPATGARELAVMVNGSFVPPSYARYLVAISGRESGELHARLHSPAPAVELEDYGIPELGPNSVEWGGDRDLRQGFVSGFLALGRALDETSITHYHVYWRDMDGTRGAPLGNIPAMGFMTPACVGLACALIEQGRTSSGAYSFERGNYTNNESATISVSGPGHVTMTRFHTENYYDYIAVRDGRSRTFSGTTSEFLNQRLPLAPGRVEIEWFSDASITGWGWRFELAQDGASALFAVPATRVHGRGGLEVVAAYGRNELPEGTFVEVVDYSADMPPSPAFVPSGLDVTNQSLTEEFFAGFATVRPQVFAGEGDVTFYRLDFADAQGAPIGDGWTQVANGSRPVVFEVSATSLPSGAVGLVARAGNSHGLGANHALKEFAELAGNSSTDGGSRRLSAAEGENDGAAATAGEMPRTPPSPPFEFWLKRMQSRTVAEVVWSSPLCKEGVCPSRGPGVRGTVAIAGLTTAQASETAIHASVARALVDALPSVGADDLQVLRVLASPTPDAVRAGVDATAKTVEFEVVPAGQATARVVDQVESRLIRLSAGGPSAERFDAALVGALRAVGTVLPESSQRRSYVGSPQQNKIRSTTTSGAGRKLQGTTQETMRPTASSSAPVVAMLVPALAAVAALLPLARRIHPRRWFGTR